MALGKECCRSNCRITKEKYLEDFVGALEGKLDEEDIKTLEKYYIPHEIMGHNGVILGIEKNLLQSFL